MFSVFQSGNNLCKISMTFWLRMEPRSLFLDLNMVKSLVISGFFLAKLQSNRSINKYKSRAITKGFKQIKGIDYIETFSFIVKPTRIRIMLSLTLSQDWVIWQLDMNTTFLNGFIKEEVYMSQLKGFEHP